MKKKLLSFMLLMLTCVGMNAATDLSGNWSENTTGQYYGSDWEDFSVTNGSVTITMSGTTATVTGLLNDASNVLTATYDESAQTLTFAKDQTIYYGGYDWQLTYDPDASATETADLVGTVSADGNTITLNGLNIFYDGYTNMYNTKVTLTRAGEPEPLADWTPVLPDGQVLNIGAKAATMTPATEAADNDHWYVMTQTRGGESMVYPSNASGSLKRGATSATATSINGKSVTDNKKYLIRFIETAYEGVYNIQFANGKFVQTTLKTGDQATAGLYFFYNINDVDTHFGWNLTTDGTTYNSRVDNNGAGNGLSFWDSGKVDYTGGNNDWAIYPATFEEPKPAVELTASATGVVVGTEITLTATASAFESEPTITYAYAKDGGETVAMESNTFTPSEAGKYVFTATATLDETVATSNAVTVNVITGEYAGSWYLKNNDTNLYATYGIGSWNSEANLNSTGTKINIAVADGAYTIQYEDQSKWLGQNSWDNQCFADGPKSYYTIEPSEDGLIIMTGSKYLTYAWDSTYEINNIIWGTTPTTWTLESTSATANMTITDAGYGTFCAPFDVTIPEGVTAYTADISTNWVELTPIETTIPACTAVVVAGAEYNNNFEGTKTTTDTDVYTGCLIGNTGSATKSVAQGYYLLQNGSNGLGWYKVTNDDLTIGKNRCYLEAPSPEARDFYGFTGTTSINSIAAEAQTKTDGKYLVKGQIVVVKDGKAYNVAGQAIK